MHFRTMILGVFFIGAVVWTAGGQSGQPAMIQGTTIAVIDTTLVFNKLQIVQDLEQFFNQERVRVQQEGGTRTEKIKTLQKELDSGAFAKDSEDYQDRQDRIEKLKLEGELWLRKQERRLRASHKDWFENVYKRMTQACQEIAQSQGVDIILADNPVDFNVPDTNALVGQILQKKVLYASPRVNLTPLVLERVDSQYIGEGGSAIIKLAK